MQTGTKRTNILIRDGRNVHGFGATAALTRPRQTLTVAGALGAARVIRSRNCQHTLHRRRRINPILGHVAENHHIVQAVRFVQLQAFWKVGDLLVIEARDVE